MGRAAGRPTKRVPWGRGAMGAPGVRFGFEGGAGRGTGAPGEAAGAEGAGPGRTMWVGGAA
jgi:hypothetical protein